MRLHPHLFLLTLVGFCLSTELVVAQSLTNDNVADVPESLKESSSWFSSINPNNNELFRRASKIPISIESLWMADEEVGLSSIDTSIRFPILKWFGSPPPIVKAGFIYTDLIPGPDIGLPRDLYEYSIGVSGVKQISERWTLRTLLGAGFATDNQNTSSDAWQFRGGAFGIYQASDKWQWSVGAIALGRDDLPVVPAIGAVWTPSAISRWDLILPHPRVNFLISEDGAYQNWLYIGGGFNGATWGYESDLLGDDRLTYSDLRVVMGWQSSPQAPPGVPYAKGRKYNLEIGFAFSRDLEFDNEQMVMPLDDVILLRIGTDY